MISPQSYIRRPVEGRNGARYLLIMLVSFAITVVGVRLYLELTGYPQLGNETFHLAHALWGGLFQALAAILILVYVNEWCFSASAVLAGMGVGLFIDEVGKFITQDNNYFFPLAAPIIYIAFVLFVLGYLFVRRQEKRDARAEMYIALDMMKALADRSLDGGEYRQLVRHLQTVADQSERDDLAKIAEAILLSIESEDEVIQPAHASRVGRLVLWLKMIEKVWFQRFILRRILIVCLLLIGVVALLKIAILLAILVNSSSLNDPFIASLLENNPLIRGLYSFNWYITLLSVESVAGALYLVALLAFLRKNDGLAVQTSLVGLTLSLTVGNTLAFYFNQFSVVMDSLGLFIVLAMVIRYRDRFLRESHDTKQAVEINQAGQ